MVNGFGPGLRQPLTTFEQYHLHSFTHNIWVSLSGIVFRHFPTVPQAGIERSNHLTTYMSGFVYTQSIHLLFHSFKLFYLVVVVFKCYLLKGHSRSWLSIISISLFLRKDSGVVTSCLLCGFQFRIIFLSRLAASQG